MENGEGMLDTSETGLQRRQCSGQGGTKCITNGVISIQMYMRITCGKGSVIKVSIE